MKLSREQPRSPGWYWFKPDATTPSIMRRLDQAVIVSVVTDPLYLDRRLGVPFPQGRMDCDEMGGLWAGPLEQPESE